MLACAAARFLARDLRHAAYVDQIVGKVRMRLTPLVNHWWNVPLM